MTTVADIMALVERIEANSTRETHWIIAPRVYRRLRRKARSEARHLGVLQKRMRRSVHRAYRRAGLSRPFPFRTPDRPEPTAPWTPWSGE